MKLALKIVLIIILGFFGQLFAPWWIIAIIPFLIEITFPGNKSFAFFPGFYGIFLLWAGYAFWMDHQTGSILSSRIALLFHLPPWPLAVVLLTGLLGGILGGLSSLSGNYLRRVF